MDWHELKKTMPRDGDLPDRAFEISALTKVLDNEQYDGLAHPFSRENIGETDEYISIWKRRPSVRTLLCRSVVDQSVSLVFSDDHFPKVLVDDPKTQKAIDDLIRQREFSTLMAEAATTGSVGSVCVMLSVLSGKPFFDVLNTAYLTPFWNPEDPDELWKISECYKAPGSDLRASGYVIPDADLTTSFWFEREWNTVAETWYQPRRVMADPPEPRVIDASRSVQHGLGFVPLLWALNLPGVKKPRSARRSIDGACTFAGGLDTQIRADYSMSQTGRTLDFGGSPRLVIKLPGGEENAPPGGLSGGPGKALILGEQSDAKYLEATMSSVDKAMEYAGGLRKIQLEATHGSRADPDKLAASQSGRAMEMLNQPLIWLASKLRKSYGDGLLLPLIRMVCRASAVVQRSEGGLIIEGKRYTDLDPTGLRLVWPRWYPPTDNDMQAEANTLNTLADAGILSAETATMVVAANYDIPDVLAERGRVLAETQAAEARAASMGAQVKANETLPP